MKFLYINNITSKLRQNNSNNFITIIHNRNNSQYITKNTSLLFILHRFVSEVKNNMAKLLYYSVLYYGKYYNAWILEEMAIKFSANLMSL